MMSARKLKTSIGIAAVLACGVSAAHAATVVNGSFEMDAGIAQDGQAFSTLAAGTGENSWSVFNSLPGWTTTSGAGIEIQTANTLGSINAQDGQHYVELDSHNNSSMQQSINFSSTGSYLLSFFYSPRDSNTASNVIDYSLFDAVSPFAAVLGGSVTGPSAGPPVTAVGVWTQISAIFVITQVGNYNLKFAAGGTNNSLGGFVDNVSIAAVPVPAGGLLLLGALGGLAALRRRKTA